MTAPETDAVLVAVFPVCEACGHVVPDGRRCDDHPHARVLALRVSDPGPAHDGPSPERRPAR